MTTPQSRLTMKDIADELNLSRVTVSSVINKQARARGISQKTVERVESHIFSRGYVPSRSALQLRRAGNEKVGLIHCGHHYPHLNQAFNSFADALADAPANLELMVVRRDRLVEGIRELVARGVSTLIWLQRSEHAVEFADPSAVNYLSNVRSIIYNYQFEDDKLTQALTDRGLYLVGVDRKAALRRLAERFKELGHDTAALPEIAKKYAVRRGRVLEQVGIRPVYSAPPIPDNAPRHSFAPQIARNLLQARREGATVAMFNEDLTAGLVMHALTAAGLHMPADLSAVGFNGDPLAASLTVPLTTTVMPVSAMVQRTLEILAGVEDERHNLFDLELIERDSLGVRLREGEDFASRLRDVEARLPLRATPQPNYMAGIEKLRFPAPVPE